MLPYTSVTVSGGRFRVDYAIDAEPAVARDIAAKICIEQTIEFPLELVQDDDIRGYIVGRVDDFFEQPGGPCIATISYADETSAYNLPQLLNVIYGNVSLFANVRVVRLHLSADVAAVFRGPRFGVRGLRELLDRPQGPLFMSALKPQGQSATALAAQASQMALGGLDIVKDDHGLSDQPYAPFRERVQRCATAVAETNAKTGGNTLYAPMLSTPSEQIWEDALWAKAQGAGALLIAPALIGFDLARRLAESDVLGLPLIGHPAMIGSYIVSPGNGFSYYAMMGQVMRLVGMDVSIFANYGGRFSPTPEQCRQIVDGCTADMHHFACSVPAPGGGMTFDNVPAMAAFYGADVMYLMGGNLHKQDMSLADSCRRLRELATSATHDGAATA